jgi:hypothetical protein
MITINLPRRTGQNSPITPTQWDDTMTTIEDAFASVPSGTGNGSVTSVAMTIPTAIFNLAGSPITSSGTLALTLDTQTANTVWAGPTTGSAAEPTFRSLVLADLPTITTAKGGTNLTSIGTAFQVLRSNTGATALEYATISSGSSRVAINNSAGTMTIDVTPINIDLITLGGTLSVAKGGTGGTTAQAGRLALLPSMTSNALKVLRVNAGETDYELATISTGITSLGGQTGGTQTFASGSTGTDFAISSAGNVHTFNIPSASASNRGLMTTGSQVIAGVKQFNANPVLAALDADTIPYLDSSKALDSTTTFAFSKANEEILAGSVRNSNVITLSSASTLDETKYFVNCNTTSAAFTVTLPAITSDLLYKEYVFADIVGTANPRHITIKANGADTLNGLLGGTFVINFNYGSATVKAVALNQWVVIQKVLS